MFFLLILQCGIIIHIVHRFPPSYIFLSFIFLDIFPIHNLQLIQDSLTLLLPGRGKVAPPVTLDLLDPVPLASGG